MEKFENAVSWGFKRIWENYKSLVILGFIFIPFILQITCKALNDLSNYFKWGIHFGFSQVSLEFWGSYLGIVPAGLIAYYVAQYQVERQAKEIAKNRYDELTLKELEKFSELLKMMSPWNSTIMTLNVMGSNSKISKDMLLEIYNVSVTEKQYNSFLYTDILNISRRLSRQDEIFKTGKSFASCYVDIGTKIKLLEMVAKQKMEYNFSEEQFDELISEIEEAERLYFDLSECVQNKIIKMMYKDNI